MSHTRQGSAEQIVPEDSSLLRGGVVLLSEVAGVDERLRALARGLVAEGYVVALPDLGWRGEAPEPDSVARPERPVRAARELVDSESLADVRVALHGLPRGHPRFVVGFGAGGTYARMAGCTLPGIAGVVEFCGQVMYAGTDRNHPVQPLDLAPGLACPIQCHFGTEDTVAPPSHVDLLEERLKRPRGGPSPAVQVFRYPGCGHGFMDPGSLEARPDAAGLAWSRALRFLDELT
ncbi:MAG: hypothetical protein EXR69_04235 [Myxococcales bacterium]|nr:hypothetical protein [Myxococcales bacterium]